MRFVSPHVSPEQRTSYVESYVGHVNRKEREDWTRRKQPEKGTSEREKGQARETSKLEKGLGVDKRGFLPSVTVL